jgi:hypothetical protein
MNADKVFLLILLTLGAAFFMYALNQALQTLQ